MSVSAAMPELSAVDRLIAAGVEASGVHEEQLHALALQIQHNLQYQHDWTSVKVHTHSPLEGKKRLPRPMLSGIPPRRVYIHPDEQIELIKAGIRDEDLPAQAEWVLPSQLRERWSLRRFGEVFDGISAVPPQLDAESADQDPKWRQKKRLLLATVEDDSTVVYYIIHDGIVKPRQN